MKCRDTILKEKILQNLKHWEKTVEYAFVLDAFSQQNINFVAPLAGKEEHAAGDAIFGKDDILILVEFKVDENALSSEEELFHNYQDTQNEMRERDGHHFLVYASKTPTGGSRLPPLVARTYFSAQEVQPAMDCLKQGVDQESFKNYISDLFNCKKADGRGSSGQISPDTLANVVGVCQKSRRVSTITLFEYAKRMFPHLTLEQTVKRSNEVSLGFGP